MRIVKKEKKSLFGRKKETETTVEMPSDSENYGYGFEDGLKEGLICGEQGAISRMILTFLNSEIAIKNKISGLNVKVDEKGNYELMWNYGERRKKINSEWIDC